MLMTSQMSIGGLLTAWEVFRLQATLGGEGTPGCPSGGGNNHQRFLYLKNTDARINHHRQLQRAPVTNGGTRSAGDTSRKTEDLETSQEAEIEPTMRMSEVMGVTGMTKEDLEFFTSSCRLIEVVEGEEDPVLSFEHVHCLVRIFFQSAKKGAAMNWKKLEILLKLTGADY